MCLLRDVAFKKPTFNPVDLRVFAGPKFGCQLSVLLLSVVVTWVNMGKCLLSCI